MTSVPPTFPTNAPTTLDFTADEFATQLNSAYSGIESWVDPTTAANLELWAANHSLADGLIPIEYDPVLGDTITSLIPDAEGTLPQFLEVNNNHTIDTTNLHLRAIFLLDGGTSTNLTVIGSGNEHIYTQDLGRPGYDNDVYTLNLQGATGKITAVLGNNDGDRVYGGSGTENITLGDGNGDGVYAGGAGNIKLGNGNGDGVQAYGSNEHVTIGTGIGDGAQVGSGLTNVAITILGANATIQDGALGTNEVLTDKAGGSTFVIGLANSETIHLGGGGNNIINVQGDPLNNATIDGVSKTDIFHFTDGFADATITTANGHTTVAFASGQTVTLTGVHDAATFGPDPSIHYI
jgi:hypothetical protein